MYDLIVNPISGGKNGKKMIKSLALAEKRLHQRKADYHVHVTEKKGHAKILTEELIKNGAKNIIAVGGDGTLHEVINGFDNFENVNLGLIPCGTGNDFASALNIPKKIEDAVDLFLDGTPKYTDFMQLPTVRCINIAGMGVDVDVLNYYENLKRKTKLGYTTCLIKALCNFEYSDFTAEYNGKKEDFRSFIACVANGYRYGGGIPICPPADATDNELDFVAVREMKRIKIIGAFLKLKKGKLLSLPQAFHEKTKEIKITSNRPFLINLDGELYKDTEFNVKIISNTLKMYR